MKKNNEYIGGEENYNSNNPKKDNGTKIAWTIILMYIAFVLLGVAFFGGFIYFIFSQFNKTSKNMINGFTKIGSEMIKEYDNNDSSENSNYYDQVQKMAKEQMKNNEIEDFNRSIEPAQGTNSKFALSSYLDKVVTSNKKNKDHVITVVYRETTTTNEDDIVKIKHMLDNTKKYEVSLDYDEDGYISKITIKDI